MAFFRRDSIGTARGCIIMKDLRFSFTTMFSINLQVNPHRVLFAHEDKNHALVATRTHIYYTDTFKLYIRIAASATYQLFVYT